MAKIVLENGVVIEGTVEELAQMADKFGVPQYRKVTDRKPRVGDYVKFSRSFVESDLDLSVDKFYEIIAVDDDGDVHFYDDDGDERIKDPDDNGVEIYEKVGAEPEPLKVGDYVVPLPEADGRYNITNTIVKLGKVIKQNDSSDSHIRIEIIAYKKGRFIVDKINVHPKYFRKATIEEIEQGKAEADKHIIERKWAKIGRKPNEFKKGDILRITEDDPSCSGHKKGDIGEIIQYDSADSVRVSGGNGGGWLDPTTQAELIVPVESRFDTAEDAE
jgi:hypothetical protein